MLVVSITYAFQNFCNNMKVPQLTLMLNLLVIMLLTVIKPSSNKYSRCC